MKYAVRPDIALSTGPQTIFMMDFLSWDECKRFTDDNDEWTPVEESMPEIKRCLKDLESKPRIAALPRPLRLWVGSDARTFVNLQAYIDNYREKAPTFRLRR